MANLHWLLTFHGLNISLCSQVWMNREYQTKTKKGGGGCQWQGLNSCTFSFALSTALCHSLTYVWGTIEELLVLVLVLVLVILHNRVSNMPVSLVGKHLEAEAALGQFNTAWLATTEEPSSSCSKARTCLCTSVSVERNRTELKRGERQDLIEQCAFPYEVNKWDCSLLISQICWE